jgi:hypothetical protein
MYSHFKLKKKKKIEINFSHVPTATELSNKEIK